MNDFSAEQKSATQSTLHIKMLNYKISSISTSRNRVNTHTEEKKENEEQKNRAMHWIIGMTEIDVAMLHCKLKFSAQ